VQDFIGYGQDQIANLDIDWQTYNGGLNAPALAGLPVLIYQAPDGGMRSKPLTEDACHRCRQALLADIQETGRSPSRQVQDQRLERLSCPRNAPAG
jgi:hypothetical protein